MSHRRFVSMVLGAAVAALASIPASAQGMDGKEIVANVAFAFYIGDTSFPAGSYNVSAKNIVQISVELTQLSEKARNRKISLDEMQGGCFSVSNLGGIGGTLFTPIVNAPEVAILGISRAKMEPVYDKASNGFVPRLMLPLSLSYDHRVVDGADGIRFLRWVVEALEQPFLLALQG